MESKKERGQESRKKEKEKEQEEIWNGFSKKKPLKVGQRLMFVTDVVTILS